MILNILLVIIAVGVILWAVGLIPMDSTVKQILKAVVVILVIWLLKVFGLWSHLLAILGSRSKIGFQKRIQTLIEMVAKRIIGPQIYSGSFCDVFYDGEYKFKNEKRISECCEEQKDLS